MITEKNIFKILRGVIYMVYFKDASEQEKISRCFIKIQRVRILRRTRRSSVQKNKSKTNTRKKPTIDDKFSGITRHEIIGIEKCERQYILCR